MKAYIINETNSYSERHSGAGPYSLRNEQGRILYQRWCTNRAFANFDLTSGNPKALEENGITEVYSNDELVWKDGEATTKTMQDFRAANYEYERINGD